MAGTISLSLTQQLDEFGAPLAGGKLYLIQAGTVSTPQNGFQDSALTLPWPNPIILDASGRLPQFFLADGSIKIRLTDVNGVEKLVADGILVTGASSGGGGGSPVDATTVLTTGDIKVRYGTGVLTGFVRCNARTIGSATSGASERANADAQSLFEYLWNTDANLTVSTGRGATANADWLANKTITLPDWRGRALAALDDMGNTAAGRLTSTYFGTAATVLGAAGGRQDGPLVLTDLPTGITSAQNAGFNVTVNSTALFQDNGAGTLTPGGGGVTSMPITHSATVTSTGTVAAGNVTTTSNNTGGTNHQNVQPTMLATVYLKL